MGALWKARLSRSFTRFMFYVDSVMFMRRTRCLVFARFLRFRTFGPFNPPSSLALTLLRSTFTTLAFLSLALHSVLNARLPLLAAISTVVFLSLRLHHFSYFSRYFLTRYVKGVGIERRFSSR